MKHILHHQTIVTKLKYYCKQCNDVDVVQKKHACFLLQFMGGSDNVIKQKYMYYLLYYCKSLAFDFKQTNHVSSVYHCGVQFAQDWLT